MGLECLNLVQEIACSTSDIGALVASRGGVIVSSADSASRAAWELRRSTYIVQIEAIITTRATSRVSIGTSLCGDIESMSEIASLLADALRYLGINVWLLPADGSQVLVNNSALIAHLEQVFTERRGVLLRTMGLRAFPAHALRCGAESMEYLRSRVLTNDL